MSKKLSRNCYKKIKRSVELFIAESDAGPNHNLSEVDNLTIEVPYLNEVREDISKNSSEDEGDDAVNDPELMQSDSDTYSSSQCTIDTIDFDENFLASWALEANVSHVHLNKLLRGLKSHRCFQHLPADARSLLKTARHVNVVAIAPGENYHFGMATGTSHCSKFCKHLHKFSTINVSINVDGLPISKSSGACFWPILCCVQSFEGQPIFPVGIYYGLSKPLNANEFLKEFVSEACALCFNGLELNGKVM